MEFGDPRLELEIRMPLPSQFESEVIAARRCASIFRCFQTEFAGVSENASAGVLDCRWQHESPRV